MKLLHCSRYDISVAAFNKDLDTGAIYVGKARVLTRSAPGSVATVVIVVSVLVVLGAVGGGGYYYMRSRRPASRLFNC